MKKKSPRVTRSEKDVGAAEMIEKVLAENPDIRLIVEAAIRAHEAESKEPPRYIGIATETVALPTNSQGPVLQGMFG